VGFQNSATGLDLGFYAARSYSLMRPKWSKRGGGKPVPLEYSIEWLTCTIAGRPVTVMVG